MPRHRRRLTLQSLKERTLFCGNLMSPDLATDETPLEMGSAFTDPFYKFGPDWQPEFVLPRGFEDDLLPPEELLGKELEALAEAQKNHMNAAPEAATDAKPMDK